MNLGTLNGKPDLMSVHILLMERNHIRICSIVYANLLVGSRLAAPSASFALSGEIFDNLTKPNPAIFN